MSKVMVHWKKRKKYGFSGAAAVCAAVVLFFAGVMPVSAKVIPASTGEDSANVSLTLTQQIAGTETTTEPFSYKLTAAKQNSPLPESEELTRTGAGKLTFDINFGEPGVYRYTLSQIPGKAEGWSYDAAVYQAEVWITSTENSNKLEAVVLYYNASGNKTEPVFQNFYQAPQTSQPPQSQNPASGITTFTKTPDTGEGRAAIFWMTAAGIACAVFTILILCKCIQTRMENKEKAGQKEK